ncbi:unnamed protein product, partial [Symbiodinium sp. KB8]
MVNMFRVVGCVKNMRGGQLRLCHLLSNLTPESNVAFANENTRCPNCILQLRDYLGGSSAFEGHVPRWVPDMVSIIGSGTLRSPIFSTLTNDLASANTAVPYAQSVDAEEMDVHDSIVGKGGWVQPLDALVGHVLGRDPKTPVFNLPADHATASTIFLVTGLIHDYSEDFIPSEALWKMKSGKKWPRSEYVSGDADFKVIAAILAGMDFRYQADLVELLRSDEPDLDKICSMFAESRDDIPDWDELLSNFMLHDNEILDYWNRKRDTAANSGTWMHAMLENLLNGYQVHAGVMQGELETAIGVLVSMNDVEVYRTERCIYAPEEDVAGSIDLVLKSRTGNDFFIVDWKRSEKLKEKYHG